MAEHSAEIDAGPLCPINGCTADLYLSVTYCIPITGEANFHRDNAVSSGWEVECVEGHKVWNDVDQIRADNAAGCTDNDETGDYAPHFRLAAMCPTSPGGDQ